MSRSKRKSALKRMMIKRLPDDNTEGFEKIIQAINKHIDSKGDIDGSKIR